MPPLFIPLKSEFYDAFADGSKTVEYRRYGPRWNARTCERGRPVILSKGYGKRHRMRGTITGFMVSNYPTQTDAWKKCYGDSTDFAACITIQILCPHGMPLAENVCGPCSQGRPNRRADQPTGD